MPRKYEITAAFNDAIKLDAKSRRGVRTNDFRLVPENYIHHQPLEEYNRWIKRYQAFLFDKLNLVDDQLQVLVGYGWDQGVDVPAGCFL